ncbi:MAG TPA: hypothetical protein VIV09_15390, partial [Pseudolabrys sp.]
ATGFLSQIEKDEDPDQATDAPEEEAQPHEEAETPTPEQEAETPAQPEVKMVEVELEDGEKVLVPEKVKHRMMADKDYRQKTMEVAAERKELARLTAMAAQTAQQAQQLAPYHAQLQTMDTRAQQLSQALSSPELAADPVMYNRVQGELAILLHQRDRFAAGLQQQVSQLDTQQQQLRAQKLVLEAPKLYAEIPDLAKPENVQKLAKYVVDEGLPQEAVDFLNYSTAGAKLAWKAHQYDQMVKDQASSRAKLQEKVKDLPAAQSSRAPDKSAIEKQAMSAWRKGGGRPGDPNFDAALRARLRGK